MVSNLNNNLLKIDILEYTDNVKLLVVWFEKYQELFKH